MDVFSFSLLKGFSGLSNTSAAGSAEVSSSWRTGRSKSRTLVGSMTSDFNPRDATKFPASVSGRGLLERIYGVLRTSLQPNAPLAAWPRQQGALPYARLVAQRPGCQDPQDTAHLAASGHQCTASCAEFRSVLMRHFTHPTVRSDSPFPFLSVGKECWTLTPCCASHRLKLVDANSVPGSWMEAFHRKALVNAEDHLLKGFRHLRACLGSKGHKEPQHYLLYRLP